MHRPGMDRHMSPRMSDSAGEAEPPATPLDADQISLAMRKLRRAQERHPNRELREGIAILRSMFGLEA
jgi:hypothetical protein